MLKLILIVGSLVAGAVSAAAQTYSFTTWAGRSPRGYADGPGPAALFNQPQDVAADLSGNLFVADSGNQVIRKITPGGVVTTLAGAPGQIGTEDGAGPLARFCNPCAVAVDRAGNVYVADNATIRKVTPAGVVTTVAGSPGEQGSVNGRGSAARFAFGSAPPEFGVAGLAADADGNLYVADVRNSTVRKMTPDGVVTTIAGRAGDNGANADHEWGLAIDGNRDRARFASLSKLTVDNSGTVIVADVDFDREQSIVRQISPGGDVTTLQLDRRSIVQGIAVDPAGNVYGASWEGVIRISPGGVVTTIAGHQNSSGRAQDGTGDAARFSEGQGLALDPSGNLFVIDRPNHAVRKITAGGIVTTVAGSLPTQADGTGCAARFRSPNGITVDAAGNVYVSDDGDLRKISPSGMVTTVARDVTVAASGYLATDPSGNIFILDQDRDGSLRKVSASGVVTTVATQVAATSFAADSSGNIFFITRQNFFPSVRKITPDGRIITTPIGAWRASYRTVVNSRGELIYNDSGYSIATTLPTGVTMPIAGMEEQRFLRDDGNGTVARFFALTDLAVDRSDNVFVLDRGALRKITNGMVTTLPVTWDGGVSGPISHPSSIAVDASGAIFICEPGSFTVSKGIAVSTPAESRLTNASVRATLRDQQPLTVGFTLRGNPRPMLLRASGPGLQPFVSNVALARDPRLSLFDRSTNIVAANDNWGGGAELTAAFAAAGAFPLAANSTDAALLPILTDQNTAQITSPTGGMTLFELFDSGPAAAAGIANISARHVIGRGNEASFALGFTIEGGARTVLIRGIGRALAAAPFNLSTALRSPNLVVTNGSGKTMATGGWGTDSLEAIFTRVGAFRLRGLSGQDPAVVLVLEPGSYSATLSGMSNSFGDALIEIYDVP